MSSRLCIRSSCLCRSGRTDNGLVLSSSGVYLIPGRRAANTYPRRLSVPCMRFAGRDKLGWMSDRYIIHEYNDIYIQGLPETKTTQVKRSTKMSINNATQKGKCLTTSQLCLRCDFTLYRIWHEYPSLISTSRCVIRGKSASANPRGSLSRKATESVIL
jgi:hypothetical protein